jgi:hypothetical protein
MKEKIISMLDSENDGYVLCSRLSVALSRVPKSLCKNLFKNIFVDLKNLDMISLDDINPYVFAFSDQHC